MKNMLMIGSAHLDPVWLWQWQEGYQEVKATFRSALDRMNEFPDFVFTCACAGYYEWVEENDPEMFAEITRRVAEGRWGIMGGMWIQPDMNTPSAESFARQLLYSQRYFKEKFGHIANTGYNVDSFGHNAMFPQLLKRAGMENYVWMRPSIIENPEIPEGPMWWEAPDGSRVMAYRIKFEYNGFHNLPEKIETMFKFADELGKPVMCFYGVGNHGGGPTIENLNEIEKYRVEAPRGNDVAYASPDDYFCQLHDNNTELPVWRDELQHHASGCYSTHSESKRKHRMAENALVRMEKFGVLSHILTGHNLKHPFVMQAWKNLMFNEFHDIMGGCSLPESMEDAVMQLNETLSIAAREENAALQRISWQVDTIKGHPDRVRSKEESWMFWGIRGQGTPVVVFNPHPFEATGNIIVRQPVKVVRDDDGNPVPCQVIRATRTNGEQDRWDGLFRATVPPLGYKLYWMFLEEGEPVANTLTASETVLENSFLRAEFDPSNGELTALIRKDSGRNVLVSPAQLRLFDITAVDTWAHNVFKFDVPAGKFGDGRVTVLEDGPARAVVRVVYTHENSEAELRYILNADSDQLDIDVRLNLNMKHRMVKFCLPTIFTDGKDVSEISCGAITRRANGDEEHCQRWVAMQGKDGGLAVFNDGKYSYSALDGELRMTLANTSIFADHYGQEMRDDTCVFMDQGNQKFKLALCPYDGTWQSANPDRRAAELNQPLVHVVETYHEGPLAAEYQGVQMDNSAISLLSFKRAENGLGYVLRLCEINGSAQNVRLDLHLVNRTEELAFLPFEIKTLFIPDDPAKAIKEILITELDAE